MKTFALCLTLLCVCGAISAGVFRSNDFPDVWDDQTQIWKVLQDDVPAYLKELSVQESVQLEFNEYKKVKIESPRLTILQYNMVADLKENNQMAECEMTLLRPSDPAVENCLNFDVECGQHKYALKKRGEGCKL